MFDRIFSKEEVNTGRQREIDLMKAYCIIMMMITHAVDDLFVNYETHLPSYIIDNVLAQSVGAQAFMISMGIGMVYTEKNTPRLYLKRGLYILVLGQALNLFRFAFCSGLTYVILKGDEWARAMMFLTFSVDILQFAGLFFLCMALFSKLKLKPVHIFIIGIIANAVGMIIGGKISTGSYAIDQLLGFFVFTETESYFPLIHWMIYPAFGILFGDILRHVKDKNTFYGILFIPCTVLMAVYYYVGIGFEQPFFKAFNDWISFCHPGLPDIIMQLFSNTAVLCVCYFITTFMTKDAMKPVNFISKNINRYYCIHIAIIAFFGNMLDILEFPYFYSAGPTYFFALCLILVTTAVVIFEDRYLYKWISRYLNGKTYVIAAVTVILLSIIVCAWAYPGITTFTNLFNNYTL